MKQRLQHQHERMALDAREPLPKHIGKPTRAICIKGMPKRRILYLARVDGRTPRPGPLPPSLQQTRPLGNGSSIEQMGPRGGGNKGRAAQQQVFRRPPQLRPNLPRRGAFRATWDCDLAEFRPDWVRRHGVLDAARDCLGRTGCRGASMGAAAAGLAKPRSRGRDGRQGLGDGPSAHARKDRLRGDITVVAHPPQDLSVVTNVRIAAKTDDRSLGEEGRLLKMRGSAGQPFEIARSFRLDARRAASAALAALARTHWRRSAGPAGRPAPPPLRRRRGRPGTGLRIGRRAQQTPRRAPAIPAAISRSAPARPRSQVPRTKPHLRRTLC